MHLKQSESWKEAKILGQGLLVEAQHHEKEYLGSFVVPPVTCAELKKIEKGVRSQLQLYCPKLNLDTQHSYLLSQLFIL